MDPRVAHLLRARDPFLIIVIICELAAVDAPVDHCAGRPVGLREVIMDVREHGPAALAQHAPGTRLQEGAARAADIPAAISGNRRALANLSPRPQHQRIVEANPALDACLGVILQAAARRNSDKACKEHGLHDFDTRQALKGENKTTNRRRRLGGDSVSKRTTTGQTTSRWQRAA